MWWVQLLNSIVGLLNGGAGGGGGAYESIATYTLASDTASISFSSIPSTYKSLQIRGLVRSTRAAVGDYIKMNFNSDTGANYSLHELYGDGTSASAYGASGQAYVDVDTLPAASRAANIFGVFIIDIHNYDSTTQYKTVRYIDGWDANGAGNVLLGSSVWMSASAISTISMNFNGGNLLTGSSIALYGIKGA